MRALVCLMAALTAPCAGAAAAPLFTPPQGCKVYVTVQQKSCTVSHLFRCAGEADLQHRVDIGADGLAYVGTIDSETQWIESASPLSGLVERLAGAEDPASFSGLLATGHDSFSFRTQTQVQGGGAFGMQYEGEDHLTGETLTLDGETLQGTRFKIIARDATGQEIWRSEGEEFIHPTWRTFLAGRSTTTSADGVDETDSSPLKFIFEGEAGFSSSAPAYGCGDAVSFLLPSGRADFPRPQQIFPS